MASEKAVLHRNVALAILVLSAKNRYSSFLKRARVFQEICFKVKVLKALKFSSDYHMKQFGPTPPFLKKGGGGGENFNYPPGGGGGGGGDQFSQFRRTYTKEISTWFYFSMMSQRLKRDSN